MEVHEVSVHFSFVLPYGTLGALGSFRRVQEKYKEVLGRFQKEFNVFQGVPLDFRVP